MEQQVTMATVTYLSLLEQEILIHLMNLNIISRKKERKRSSSSQREEGKNGIRKGKEETSERNHEGIVFLQTWLWCIEHNGRTETQSA